MPNATTITIVGNLTADVELTFTQAGVARASGSSSIWKLMLSVRLA
jgi:single-stranded DNA-binding protein